MSQEQQQRPQSEQEPIKYGDVFPVSGELAGKPITPQDAAMMQMAEAMVLGKTQKGGTAAVMQSAAAKNERAGLVGHEDVTDVAQDRGILVEETDIPGRRIITEAVGGQVVGQTVDPMPVDQTAQLLGIQENAITIGEALEAAVHTAGDRPVDQSDAAAIQAAEARATGSSVITPGGLAATAQSAASFNSGMQREEDKIKLSEVLTAATARLPADKAVTAEDAEGVKRAELRNEPNAAAHHGGVADSLAAAARLNERIQ